MEVYFILFFLIINITGDVYRGGGGLRAVSRVTSSSDVMISTVSTLLICPLADSGDVRRCGGETNMGGRFVFPLLVLGSVVVERRGGIGYFEGQFSFAGVGGAGLVSGTGTRGGKVPGIPGSKMLFMAAGGKCCFSFSYRWVVLTYASIFL